MTSLIEALKEETGRRYSCKFRDWLSTLDETELKAVEEAMADESKSSNGLHQVFSQFGLTCDRQVVGKHRKGLCRACGPN